MNIRFYYPSQTYYTDALPGVKKRRLTHKTVCGEGHILVTDFGNNQSLLCGVEMDKIEKSIKADSHTITENRLDGTKLCADCQKAWKESPNSEWKN